MHDAVTVFDEIEDQGSARASWHFHILGVSHFDGYSPASIS